ncbi:unnamed protein product [Rotaria socialis]|uniref:Protein translocase subunit SecA n=2 Tax=Rotaria socialis TaxID=392032 RepID=A0A818K6L3_9BILA|nr:unnamed protein product [Rotaria socialis]
MKSAGELIKELLNSNSHNQNLLDLSEKNLRDRIEKIKSSKLTSLLFTDNEQNKSNQNNSYSSNPIVQWTQNQIQLWANLVEVNPSILTNTEDFIIEALAVIKQANFLDTEFHLIDAQISSCLIALNTVSNQGKLLQVGTGEGESTIISVLAVVHALKGENVDIITSSPVLAERDSKEKEKFYRMFDLQCSDNNDRAIYLTGPKSCYKKQIVYGKAAQFQFDTLRTEYAQLNTLADRKCDVAIVDEVDSMLIDDSSKIARLATIMSGMDHLQIIYHLLWNQLILLQERIIEFNNKFYLFYGKITFEEETVTLEYANEQGNIMIISDLKKYLLSSSDISHIGQLIPENEGFDKFIKKNLENYIRKFLNENIKIPKNFTDFVETQIPTWIDNAIIAFNYQESIHYVVHAGLIKPVDYYSTGVVQSFSNWSDGLHQFFQIKHGLKMASETFTTNFLPNRGYFTKYSSNLFGLTGTLGSEKAKQVLVDVYNVDLVIIPNLRQKQYLSLPDSGKYFGANFQFDHNMYEQQETFKEKMSASTFELLPVDIFFEIFGYLSPVEILKSFLLVNKRFSRIVLHEYLWHIHIGDNIMSLSMFSDLCQNVLKLIGSQVISLLDVTSSNTFHYLEVEGIYLAKVCSRLPFLMSCRLPFNIYHGYVNPLGKDDPWISWSEHFDINLLPAPIDSHHLLYLSRLRIACNNNISFHRIVALLSTVFGQLNHLTLQFEVDTLPSGPLVISGDTIQRLCIDRLKPSTTYTLKLLFYAECDWGEKKNV